jgi:hypothetical protein
MGNLVEQGARVTCAHQGTATPPAVNPRVTLGGRPTSLVPPPWTVAGCTLPPSSGGPCVTATWTTGTTRVTSGGQPLVVSTGSATCAPTGVPLTVTMTQVRVSAT